MIYDHSEIFDISVMSSDAVKKRKPKFIRNEAGTPETKRRAEGDQVSSSDPKHTEEINRLCVMWLTEPIINPQSFFSSNNWCPCAAEVSQVTSRVQEGQVEAGGGTIQHHPLIQASDVCLSWVVFRWVSVSRYVDVRLMWRVYCRSRIQPDLVLLDRGSWLQQRIRFLWDLSLSLSLWQLKGQEWTLIKQAIWIKITIYLQIARHSVEYKNYILLET